MTTDGRQETVTNAFRIFALIRKKPYSLAMLTHEIGCEHRTIRRALDAMAEAGVVLVKTGKPWRVKAGRFP